MGVDSVFCSEKSGDAAMPSRAHSSPQRAISAERNGAVNAPRYEMQAAEIRTSPTSSPEATSSDAATSLQRTPSPASACASCPARTMRRADSAAWSCSALSSPCVAVRLVVSSATAPSIVRSCDCLASSCAFMVANEASASHSF